MRLDGVLRGCAAEAVQGRVFGKRSSKMHSRECVTEGVRQRVCGRGCAAEATAECACHGTRTMTGGRMTLSTSCRTLTLI